MSTCKFDRSVLVVQIKDSNLHAIKRSLVSKLAKIYSHTNTLELNWHKMFYSEIFRDNLHFM